MITSQLQLAASLVSMYLKYDRKTIMSSRWSGAKHVLLGDTIRPAMLKALSLEELDAGMHKILFASLASFGKR